MSDETPERKNFESSNGRGSMSYEKGIDAGLLLPGQYVDLVRRNEVMVGELKLLLAVLEDAIRCYLRNVNAKDGARRRDFVEARTWFGAGGDAAAARRAVSSASTIFAPRLASSHVACLRACGF